MLQPLSQIPCSDRVRPQSPKHLGQRLFQRKRPVDPAQPQQSTHRWLLSHWFHFLQAPGRSILQFWQQLPLLEDFRIIFERDPAARNRLEVLLCYPGLHAIACYRLAHGLHQRQWPILPRFISHLARFLTGIEIHPGATLGKGIVIDHGMGVVIGETAIVGDYALIYQGVTLGGTGKETGKRHPTLGNHVVVGAGAKVLGNILIGDNARIGAGSIVLRSVPANCTAVGVPGRNICRSTASDCPLDHNHLPDAQATVIRQLFDRIEALESQLQHLSSDQNEF